MNPIRRHETKELACWRKGLFDDKVVYAIIKSGPFSRLKDISFLGAIDYLSDRGATDAFGRSRAAHSLDVAAITSYVASKRDYNADRSRHLVVAALLHDIGHAPLSHSAEPVFKERFGLGHHEQGERLIEGDIPGSQAFSRYLRRYFDKVYLKALISGSAPDEEGGDLFSCPVNVDTIDGIWRSASLYQRGPSAFDRLSVARAAYLDGHDDDTLDNFWHLKGHVYNTLIHSRKGLLADNLSQRYLASQSSDLSEHWLYEDELAWKTRFKPLFETLLRVSDVPSDDLSGSIDYTAREYVVSPAHKGFERYRVNKKSAQISV